LVIAATVAACLAAHAAANVAAPPRWIVFSGEPDGTPVAQLFRVQTSGAGLEQITNGRAPATSPAFSPDGTQVVFARLSSGIFRVNLDGTGLHRLTSGGRDSYPVWSPDGKRVAFLRPYRTSWRVYVVPVSGGVPQRLRLAPPAGRPSWQGDGKAMFIPSGGELAKIDAQTGNVQKYLGVSLDLTTAQGATLSPDAKRIAFLGKRINTGPPDCGESRCPAFALYLADVSGKKLRRIANDTGPAGWSPDGKTLIFVARGALTLSDVGTGKKTTISSGTNVAAGDTPPAWQPR
jgi:TolB protein